MEQKRTLCVKGVGRAAAKPDSVEISITVKAENIDYAAAAEAAEIKLSQIKEAVTGAGLKTKDLVTADYSVNTVYRNERGDNGEYKSVFCGYCCRHALKLQFDFSAKTLDVVLCELSKCNACPDLGVRFTVKDAEGINAEAIKKAVNNAVRQAQILAQASGVSLGEIISIEYGEGGGDFYSPTVYSRAKTANVAAFAADINPDEVTAQSIVTTVWQIK